MTASASIELYDLAGVGPDGATGGDKGVYEAAFRLINADKCAQT